MTNKDESKTAQKRTSYPMVAFVLFLLAPACLTIGTGDPTNPSLAGLLAGAVALLCAISAMLKKRLMIIVFAPIIFLLGLMTLTAPLTGWICGPIVMFLSATAFFPVVLSSGKNSLYYDYSRFTKGWEKLKLGNTAEETLSLIGKPTKKQTDEDKSDWWLYTIEKDGLLTSTTYSHRVVISDNKVAEIIPDSDYKQVKK